MISVSFFRRALAMSACSPYFTVSFRRLSFYHCSRRARCFSQRARVGFSRDGLMGYDGYISFCLSFITAVLPLSLIQMGILPFRLVRAGQGRFIISAPYRPAARLLYIISRMSPSVKARAPDFSRVLARVLRGHHTLIKMRRRRQCTGSASLYLPAFPLTARLSSLAKPING